MDPHCLASACFCCCARIQGESLLIKCPYYKKSVSLSPFQNSTYFYLLSSSDLLGLLMLWIIDVASYLSAFRVFIIIWQIYSTYNRNILVIYSYIILDLHFLARLVFLLCARTLREILLIKYFILVPSRVCKVSLSLYNLTKYTLDSLFIT